MSALCKSLIPVLTGAALLGASLAEARGQARVVPGLNQPSASTQIGAARANYSLATQGGNNPLAVSRRVPVGGVPVGDAGGFYPGFGNTWVMPDPYSGYLNGAANVISSQADFMKAQQEAQLTEEQVKQERFTTRRKQLEEWRYEQEIMPTAEELRQKQAKAEIDRARGNPPLTDIRSASALNTLLDSIYKSARLGIVGPTIMLDPEMLKHINLTDGTSNSGVGLMRAGGKLEWPFPLEKEWFDADRKKTEDLMVKAVSEARSGRVSAKTIQGLIDVEDSLRATLKDHVNDLTPTHGIQARRYINELHDTIGTLQDKNVSKYVGGAWTPQGNTMAELVNNMMRQGLKFAPCADGDDSYYRAMYQMLLAYDQSLAMLASRPTSSATP